MQALGKDRARPLFRRNKKAGELFSIPGPILCCLGFEMDDHAWLPVLRLAAVFFFRTKAFNTASSFRASGIISAKGNRFIFVAGPDWESSACAAMVDRFGKSDFSEAIELFMNFRILDFDLYAERQIGEIFDGDARRRRDQVAQALVSHPFVFGLSSAHKIFLF
jgi:hypothetical protein